MKNEIKYSKGDIGKVKIINDFLHPLQDLILKDDSVKVTISLSRESIDFFKFQAANAKVPYQKMIRTLLDKYAGHYSAHKKA